MKNNFFTVTLLIFYLIFKFNLVYADEFNFDVTEIEILDNGKIFKGLKRGKVTTNDGLVLNADEFEYNKVTNILIANGNVKISDQINNYLITSNKIIYLRNKNIIFTSGNSKVESINDNLNMIADNLEYDKIQNKITAEGNVFIEDKINKNQIFADKISYFKNEEKILTFGKTRALIDTKYNFNSKDVTFLKNKNKLSSESDTTIIDDNSQLYNVSKFIYSIDTQELKGENILISTNYNLPSSDKFYFSSAIINLKDKNFIAKDTKINIHKNIFSNIENDPRIIGVSSKSNGNETIINKGTFTSCKQTDKCPPWSISAERIEHDKKNKQIKYKNAFLRIYDKPVLYFPKFFHPDPTVNRQSGFLKPEINQSDVLGSSFTQPYYFNLSENKDFTLRPTWFDKDISMFQNEYRQVNPNSSLVADFGFVKGFKSTRSDKRKNLNHLFFNFDYDMDLENYISSELTVSIEKTNNDTYLKLFDPHITKSKVRPENFDKLKNKFEINLNHENYNFITGIISYEDLQITNKSDRYQYVLPYYNFDKILSNNFFSGSLSFASNGSNDLNNTNQLKSNIINDLSYQSENFISNLGISNNFNLNLKNLNSVGKNYAEYKSKPQTELSGILSFNSSMPLQKVKDGYKSYLTPKSSIRFNPSDMKNNSSENKKINTGNIFNLNRLGLSDTIESGKSLTLGLDYKIEKIELEDVNKYFEFKLATVLRDKKENFIPTISTINKKNSNIFGTIDNNLLKNFKIKYDFAVDNNLNQLEYNNLTTSIKFEDLKTTFRFIEENGEMGDNNVLENTTLYEFDKNNSITFNTRRNRKLNLTEYYDLIYEYKNDCLTAGIKYKKTYYEDRDVRPSENLLFTVTLFPLTTYEYAANEILGN